MTQDVSDDARGDELGNAPGETSGTESVDEAQNEKISEEPSDLERALAEVDENRDRYLRLAAELDNLRKRTTRELENARKYGLEQLAQALLPVRDSLEAGVAAAENADLDALLEGKRATLRLLDTALEQAGILEVDPEGEPFDPERHEAMTTQPSTTASQSVKPWRNMSPVCWTAYLTASRVTQQKGLAT